MLIEDKLKNLGLTLPVAPSALATYVAVQRSNNLLFVSGQLPFEEGKLNPIGKVGTDVSIEEAIIGAQNCALNSIAQLKEYIKDLSLIGGVVKLTVFVAVANNFYDIAKVANGASDLFVQLWEEKGKHARSAVGVAALPLNAAVEVETIFNIKEK
ncbi:RidA family protein [Bartonella sp. TP]|uniref:RidA family protein n=1 Tax=Bartonella sp. TP TaxID=3057550 RepID=UPI0025B15A98|nr:RidA family protein [Bartonella sp. TP]MDN5249468.1 RidA family protein [Alphaproteobacteria bacterium]WJW79870.1 RidA family protein [Bartonella sp. TP]